MSLTVTQAKSGLPQSTWQTEGGTKSITQALPIRTTMKDAFSRLTSLKAAELRQIIIAEDGEFFSCESAKESLDVVTHIKSVLRSRGYGCYALHDYVWIVPFVHARVHIPDFERAKTILPDLKGKFLADVLPNDTLAEKAISEDVTEAGEASEPEVVPAAVDATPTPTRLSWRQGIAGLAALLGGLVSFSLLVMRHAKNAR